MQKLKTPVTLAGILAFLVVALQWLVAQWEPIAALLLSLGVSEAVLATVQTIIVLVLTLLGVTAGYQVKARGLWAK